MYNNKNVLVTGGTGLIGRPLVEMLIERGAKVRIASLDAPSRAHPKAEFVRADLTRPETCMDVCRGMDIVFHLAAIKGSPVVATQKPATFYVPNILMHTNMMESARRCGVKNYLFTSSVGVYAPAEIFYEDTVWKTFPSENDRFGAWSKRMGEMQAEAYKIEYGWKNISIVRPANVYGTYDNFDPENSMVIPSLIRRVVEGENPLVVWGDGSPIRDFIHAKDVARGMLLCVEKGISEPVNLGSGTGISIRQLVETVVSQLNHKIDVVWDSSKPNGDKMRVLDPTRARSIGFKPEIPLAEGIKEVIDWYRKNKDSVGKNYNIFKENQVNA